MGNSLSIDLTGRIVRFKQDRLCVPAEDHPFLVTGGFGANPGTSGTALFGVFLSDGERARMSGWDVDTEVAEGDLTDQQRELLRKQAS